MSRAKLVDTYQRAQRPITNNISRDQFKNAYNSIKSGTGSKYSEHFLKIPKVNPSGVFANHPTSLKYIAAYGFDYDHTLANYRKSSGAIIYENAINYLIERENYPHELCRNEFNPDFAIRGLQFDRLTGNVMKINQFHKLNPRTIYNGHEKVLISDILDQYGGVRVSEIYYKKNMKEVFDLFGVPECCLYCDIIQFFKDNKYDYQAEYIADDVLKAINYIHDSGIFHRTVCKNPEKYVEKHGTSLSSYISKLRSANKDIFLLTNSSYDYISSACDYLFEDVLNDLNLTHWTQIFNWTIVSAQKPKWYHNKTHKQSINGKFRKLDIDFAGNAHKLSFKPVNNLENGCVYTNGSLQEFHHLTRLSNDRVIYFGDNIGSDLIGPSKGGQWKTCAIIKELEREIDVGNDDNFRKSLSYLLDVEHLWFDGQHLIDGNNDNEITEMLNTLSMDRNNLRWLIKESYNKQFGSIFRTHSTRTLFFHRLARYCDLYTSKIINMSEYPLNYKFGSRRQFYDHEPIL